jgi:lipid-A-disaccharide synthase-like uncharacterized protein
MSAADPGFAQQFLTKLTSPWALVGFIGQALFTARFVVQWLASEKAGRSVVPIHFWVLSLFGTWLVLAYAIYRADPVFILAYAFNTIVYVRNLMLIRRERSGLA